MTIGELKKLIEQISDDFIIDVVGEHSGSFGSPLRASTRVEDTPDGGYSEFRLFIDA